MNKYEIACHVSKKTGKPLKDVIPVVSGVFEVMADNIIEDERINISALGSFSLKVREEKVGYDPYRGTRIVIPEGRSLRFKASPSIQKKIKTRYDKKPVAQ